MTARTPVHSYYIDADFNVCHGATIMEPIEIVATIDALTAQVAALREALTIALDSLYAMSDRWPFGTETVTHGRCITAIQQARAALAKDGAE